MLDRRKMNTAREERSVREAWEKTGRDGRV